MAKNQDKIYASQLNQIVDFRFDEKVADVFPDMINRSVPGYGLMISTIGVIAEKYARSGSCCYDLGCSLGAVSLIMQKRITQPGCRIIAVDNSQPMLDRARDLLSREEPTATPVTFVCEDIQNTEISNASVVVLNLTLQFVPPEQRLALIRKIYDGLNPGGVLVLSEKITFAETDRQNFQKSLHESFKRAQGYSDLEISQKRSALENVMIPETLSVHQDRLQRAGFEFIDVWFQCLNFTSLVAIK